MRKAIAKSIEKFLFHPTGTKICGIVAIIALTFAITPHKEISTKAILAAKPFKTTGEAKSKKSKTVRAPEILWKYKIGISSWRNNPLFVGKYLYVGSSGEFWNQPDSQDGIYAFEAKTGKKQWFVPSKIDVNDIAYMEGLIVAGNDLGELLAISAKNGNTKWQIKLKGAIYAKPVYTDKGIIVATGDGYLYLIDLNDGKILDQTIVEGGVRAGLSTDGANTYVATEKGNLYHFTIDGKFNLSSKLSIIYPSRYGSTLSDVPPEISRFSHLGQNKYSKAKIYSTPLILDDKLILGFVRTTSYSYPAVMAIELQDDGKLDKIIWYGTDINEQIGTFGNVRFTPAYKDGYIFLGNPYSNTVYALDENDGKLIWETALGQPMFQHWSSPIVNDKGLFIGRHDGHLHQLNPSNGEHLFSIFLGNQENAGNVFLEEDEIPGADLSAAWAPANALPIFATPAYSKKMLAIGTDEGYLYVIKI